MNCLTDGHSKEMNSGINRYGKRIFAVCCVVLIVLLQVVFVVPAGAKTTAGEELEVRVQYEGERGGKIRTIAVFSNADLEAMGAHNQMFSNITRVGTVMHSAAYCIELERIIETAGIDLDSVKSFTFRTSDGYTMTFNGSDYLGTAGWYYPELSRLSDIIKTGNDEGLVQLESGALEGGHMHSNAVLALKSHSLKGLNRPPEYSKMTATKSYRFFTGQTDLSYLRYEDEEGNEAFHPTTEDDITAWDSVKYIYGVDVVLKGTPPLDGISLEVLGDDMKVGSQVQVQVTFEGDTLGIFSNSDVTWSSSDKSIATVDKNGVVTILNEGEVTITAEAAGHTASVTINIDGEEASDEDKTKTGNNEKDDKDKKDKENPDKVKATTKATKPAKEPTTTTTATKPRAYKKPDLKEEQKEDNKKKVFIAREISIGKEIKQDPKEAEMSVSVKSDAQALAEVEAYDKKIVTGSAAAALLACGGGAVFRIRRFRIDMGHGIKWKK